MRKRGFTLIELMITVAFIGTVFTLLALPMANVWVTESSALRCARRAAEEVEVVTEIQRNIFSNTRVSAKTKDGKRVLVEMDANVLFNASCHFVAKE